MRFGMRGLVVAVVVGAALPVSAAGSVEGGARQARGVQAEGLAQRSAGPRLGAVTTASVRETVEGSRYTIRTTVKSPARATKVTLQKFNPPEYSFEEPGWDDVKTVSVRGRSRIKTTVVAAGPNSERYRAVVRYPRVKPIPSRPVTVRIWRWIPLSDYDPYYETGGTTTVGTFGINGNVYTGFGPYLYSHVGSWEARFTPGRHCKAFRGIIGLDDDSDDGSSGTISIISDDTQAYVSPSLTPGMTSTITVPLATPYRLGIRLSDTSPGGTENHDAIESYPAIGDPALLCTGV